MITPQKVLFSALACLLAAFSQNASAYQYKLNDFLMTKKNRFSLDFGTHYFSSYAKPLLPFEVSERRQINVNSLGFKYGLSDSTDFRVTTDLLTVQCEGAFEAQQSSNKISGKLGLSHAFFLNDLDLEGRFLIESSFFENNSMAGRYRTLTATNILYHQVDPLIFSFSTSISRVFEKGKPAQHFYTFAPAFSFIVNEKASLIQGTEFIFFSSRQEKRPMAINLFYGLGYALSKQTQMELRLHQQHSMAEGVGVSLNASYQF